MQFQSLPSNFAELVLDLEVKVEQNSTKELVLCLFNLYSVFPKQKAIQYYRSIHNPKHLFYHQRLVRLLNNEGSLSFLQASADFRSSQGLDQTVQSHEHSSNSSSHSSLANLRSQEHQLQEKIQKRRTRYAGTVSKTQEFEDFQQKMQGVLEEFGKHKEAALGKIHRKFHSKVKKIRGLVGEPKLLTLYLSQEQAKLEQELEDTRAKLDRERAWAIEKLRFHHRFSSKV